ncbi:hypothetical protein POM88_003856 [Heracleum sosnowskyi]|uniref:Uncharacterized protein n=1 Tax=Heracleum sosnowskyi TaxID=360622 RepID=A0AAD8NDF5_9APIA|nr:hypothetical protein POM88_003856 [Heracleum sosnowskyi]
MDELIPVAGDVCKSDIGIESNLAAEIAQMFDPNGNTGWSVTFVDWSEMKCHPRSFRAQDVTFDLLKTMTSIKTSVHITSDAKVSTRPCIWNGMNRPCFLFGRKFYSETLDNLMHMFSNYTSI